VISPARIAAFDALRAVSSGRADLPAALATIRQHLHDSRDQALSAELVTGTLRWQNEIDFLIGHSSQRSIERLDFEVLQILRLGVYQLLHLDRIPASAAVNDAVAMTRRARKSSAAGLVNAVLRTISRTKRSLPLPGPGIPLDYLEITLSHPRWLSRRWLERLGFSEASAWERFNNVAAPLTLRVNRIRTDRATLADELSRAGIDVVPCALAPDGLLVRNGNPLHTPLADSGSFFLQDEASQIVSLLPSPRKGELILDACASPGGKTTSMAATQGTHVVAADVRDARMRLLRETVRHSGAQNVRLVQADLQAGLPFKERFDVVFVDAPCSGLGTIRRDPDIRWRRKEEDLDRFQSAQVSMLHNAAAVLKHDGRLVYATCSSEPDENERVVERFLTETKETFAIIDPRIAAPPLAAVVGDDRLLRTSPSKHGLEAFFGAVLQRKQR